MKENDEFNYLSLEDDGDKKVPLIEENSAKRDSEKFDPESFFSKIKTIKTTETEEDEKEKEKKEEQELKDLQIQKVSSSEVDSSDVENTLNIYKKQQDEDIKKLVWACVIYTFFMIIEIIGGYLANSIAIMSDASLLLSDLLGFIISIISIYISRKIAKNDMNYGYNRAEIIGSLVSIILICPLTIWLIMKELKAMKSGIKLIGIGNNN